MINRTLLIILMVSTMISLPFTGCTNNNYNGDNPFIGTWDVAERDGNPIGENVKITWEFKTNGTIKTTDVSYGVTTESWFSYQVDDTFMCMSILEDENIKICYTYVFSNDYSTVNMTTDQEPKVSVTLNKI